MEVSFRIDWAQIYIGAGPSYHKEAGSCPGAGDAKKLRREGLQ
jgi:hypothetical protein